MKREAGIVGTVSVEWDGKMLILRSKNPTSKKSAETLRQLFEAKVQQEIDMKVRVQCGEETAVLFLAKYGPTDLQKLEGCSCETWAKDPPSLAWESRGQVLVIQSRTVLSLDDKKAIGGAVKKKLNELAAEAAAAQKKQKRRKRKEKKAARKHLPQLNYDPR
jgi:hypothetical protein